MNHASVSLSCTYEDPVTFRLFSACFKDLGEFSNVEDAAVRAKAYDGVAIQCSRISYRPGNIISIQGTNYKSSLANQHNVIALDLISEHVVELPLCMCSQSAIWKCFSHLHNVHCKVDNQILTFKYW